MAGCGEVFALLVALRFLGPTVTTIATDCKMVLDIWSKGPLQDLSDVCFSELWVDMIRIVTDTGLGNLSMVKVKSHLSRAAALSRGIPCWAWAGNREADRLARLGAEAQTALPYVRQ
eukprot:6877865-Pyramimonas_sp.AAC.1